MTIIIRSLKVWQKYRQKINLQNGSIGFVPTMGNLHLGHKSLLLKAREENSITVLSIFANPTQFDDPEDLKKYPRTLKADLNMAKDIGIDFVLLPNAKDIYPDDFHYRIIESQLSKKLCGKFRPGHFTGMLTVILKLLLLVKASKAYFGGKDFQQTQLVKGMANAFFLDTKIITCPTVRDKHGMALSSRNNLLRSKEIILARNFPKLLKSKNSCAQIAQMLKDMGFQVDYIEEYFGRRFGAVRIGKVRLIDNVRSHHES